jgi:hypothetical protein
MAKMSDLEVAIEILDAFEKRQMGPGYPAPGIGDAIERLERLVAARRETWTASDERA